MLLSPPRLAANIMFRERYAKFESGGSGWWWWMVLAAAAATVALFHLGNKRASLLSCFTSH